MKPLLLGLLVMVIFGGAACCILFNKNGGSDNIIVQEADPKAAEVILKNLAGALKMHSAQTGGGGNCNFAQNFSQISGLYANKIKPALPGPEQTSFYGYIVRLEENPAGDNFATNFLLIAYPADGYKGDVFVTDKKEFIENLTDNQHKNTK